ncbi:MAG: hypothetical protein ACYDHN_04820 [Solirubrobacteraceae bacterium]
MRQSRGREADGMSGLKGPARRPAVLGLIAAVLVALVVFVAFFSLGRTGNRQTVGATPPARAVNPDAASFDLSPAPSIAQPRTVATARPRSTSSTRPHPESPPPSPAVRVAQSAVPEASASPTQASTPAAPTDKASTPSAPTAGTAPHSSGTYYSSG